MKLEGKKTTKFDYSWVMIALCFLSVMASLGLCSSGRTMYLTAITDALDIPRGAFSLNNTFRFITTTVMNLFLGNLIAKFGTKKLICTGFICLILFALINATTESLIGFYIAGILLGLGLAWTSTTMVSIVVKRWCTKNTATVTGLVLAANGIGGAVAVQFLSPIIFKEGDPFGYRTSYKIVAGILAVVLLLMIVFYREKKDAGPVSAKKRKARSSVWEGISYEEARRKPYFYISMAAVFLTGMTLQGLSGIATPHMYDVGMSKAFVANVASVGSLVFCCTKFLTGWSYDRFGIKTPLFVGLGCAMFSTVSVIFLSNTPAGQALAWIRMPINNLAMPLETVMLPILASEFFGDKSFDKIVGCYAAANYAGFAIGSPFGNVCYDIFGDYKLAFAVFTALMAVVIVMQTIALKQSRKEMARVARQAELLPEE